MEQLIYKLPLTEYASANHHFYQAISEMPIPAGFKKTKIVGYWPLPVIDIPPLPPIPFF